MRKSNVVTVLLVVLVAVLFAAGCKPHASGGAASGAASSSATPASGAAEKSLYERLGGGAALTAVVGDFVDNVAADQRINHFFQDADLPKLKTNLTNLIGQATGGPEKYTGRDMKTTHQGMGIADADFNALVEDLTKSLDKHQVGATEKGELIALLAGMKGDIVEK
ncbi:MAG TPA: group 1 truncated hemoglobin [Candidatus Saccharimonadaceae bacterium]|jgi:hemoglobin|nr:group 1 truncated hemoglobin [Candidatus Saccharimonadaceae bacterium]